MTISKATVLTLVNDRSGEFFAGTELDDELLSILQEIASVAQGILQKSASVVVASSAISGTLPTGYVSWLTLTDSSNKPLTWCDSLQELMNYQNADTSQGTPDKFTITDKLYVYPTASSQATLTLHFNYEDTDVNSIQLPDVAQEAVVEGLMHKVELSKGIAPAEITSDSISHYQLYQDQLKVLAARYAQRK